MNTSTLATGVFEANACGCERGMSTTTDQKCLWKIIHIFRVDMVPNDFGTTQVVPFIVIENVSHNLSG